MWPFSKPRSKQTTFCWCPDCRFELCAGGTFLSDDEHGVKYKCAECGRISIWDFDMPVPVRVS
jgi:predicted RNA-binding Zn-ribbon protein involved in translation (DUF1610 family)